MYLWYRGWPVDSIGRKDERIANYFVSAFGLELRWRCHSRKRERKAELVAGYDNFTGGRSVSMSRWNSTSSESLRLMNRATHCYQDDEVLSRPGCLSGHVLISSATFSLFRHSFRPPFDTHRFRLKQWLLSRSSHPRLPRRSRRPGSP